jgi:hypothetical protein
MAAHGISGCDETTAAGTYRTASPMVAIFQTTAFSVFASAQNAS